MKKDSREMLINATMMQLRASATTCIATIEAILENPVAAVEGTEYVGAIMENLEKLAHYDNTMRVMHQTFLSPMAQKRKSESHLTPEQEETLNKQRMETFLKAQQAVKTKNENEAKTGPTTKTKKTSKKKKHDMYTDEPTDKPNV